MLTLFEKQLPEHKKEVVWFIRLPAHTCLATHACLKPIIPHAYKWDWLW